MFAYRRVLEWVADQPASAMRKRARTDLAFDNFYRSPDKYRGALVELVLNARMVRPCELRASDGSELYEVWGFANDSGAWLYDTIVLNLPPGMPAGDADLGAGPFRGLFLQAPGLLSGGRQAQRPAAGRAHAHRAADLDHSAPRAGQVDVQCFLGLLRRGGFRGLLLLQLAWLIFRPKRRKSTIRPLASPGPGMTSGPVAGERGGRPSAAGSGAAGRRRGSRSARPGAARRQRQRGKDGSSPSDLTTTDKPGDNAGGVRGA